MWVLGVREGGEAIQVIGSLHCWGRTLVGEGELTEGRETEEASGRVTDLSPGLLGRQYVFDMADEVTPRK